MVCIPCFVIPFFLFIWYRYLQPLVLKFWNPWKQVEDKQKGQDLSKELSSNEGSIDTAISSEKACLIQHKLKAT